MKITVRLFASYREAAGMSQTDIDVGPGSTVGHVASELSKRFPELPEPSRIVVAVNNEYQEHSYQVSDGDEIALIPPVSGG